ncbi:MAG TPA: polysaccharide deacetylase family protein [Solirubrobacteraceae bacterium]
MIRRRRITAILAGLLVIAVLAAAVKLVSGGGGGGGGATHAAIAGTPIGSAARSPTHVSTRSVKPTKVGAAAGTATTAVTGTSQVTGLPSSAQLAADPGTGRPGTAGVPVLMYHVIAAPPPGAPFPGLYVTPDLFAAQMHALQAAGWHGVTLDQMEAYWKRGVPLPKGKPIVVSFDNGYQSQYTKAFPVLRAMGWAAVENIQLTGLPPSQGGFVAGQVKGLVAAGWELDTQGFSHADLVKLSPSDLHYQVAVSRTVIQKKYGVPVNWFCYPSGHYDATVVAAVKAAGYLGSTTVVPGWAGPGSDLDRLPRLRVLGGTAPDALLAQIAAIRSNGPPPASYDPT